MWRCALEEIEKQAVNFGWKFQMLDDDFFFLRLVANSPR